MLIMSKTNGSGKQMKDKHFQPRWFCSPAIAERATGGSPRHTIVVVPTLASCPVFHCTLDGNRHQGWSFPTKFSHGTQLLSSQYWPCVPSSTAPWNLKSYLQSMSSCLNCNLPMIFWEKSSEVLFSSFEGPFPPENIAYLRLKLPSPKKSSWPTYVNVD